MLNCVAWIRALAAMVCTLATKCRESWQHNVGNPGVFWLAILRKGRGGAGFACTLVMVHFSSVRLTRGRGGARLGNILNLQQAQGENFSKGSLDLCYKMF